MDFFMLFQSYTDRYFIHKKNLSSANFRASKFLLLFLLLTCCTTNQEQLIKQNVDAEFLNQSFIISGSISIKSNAGNFIGSYKLENAFGESFQVNDIFGRKVFLAEPTINNELIGQLDERSLEIYQYFQEWGSISSILLAIDDFDELKSKLNISITYRGTQIVNSYRIPRTISVIGNDYELTFAIKKLNFT
tara:strand:+ start:1958 stop:2530 length:573 start_codon:yes stop_codon:yes gene_type:complete